MLDKLATAHGLEPREYVEELIEACNEIVEEEADVIEEINRGSKKGAEARKKTIRSSKNF